MSKRTFAGGLIRPVQYLRGIAALMVVWHHALSQIAGTTDFIRLPDFGPAGVDIFFVISGFIMVATTAGKPISGLRFSTLRIVRVVPLYWLATLGMIAIAIAIPSAFKTLKFDEVSILKSLAFVPYDSLASPGQTWPVLIPGWTLNFEMFFYALFAISLTLPKWRLQAMLGALAALVLAGAVLGRPGPLSFVYTSPMLLEFGAGMWIAHEWLQGKRDRGLVVSLGMVAAGFGLLTQMNSRPCLIVGATLIVLGALNPRLCEMRSRPLLELGNASYSIYLTHLFTLGILRVVWMRFIPGISAAGAAAFMALALVGSSIAGWVCYRFIERPMTDWLHARIRRIYPAAAQVSDCGASPRAGHSISGRHLDTSSDHRGTSYPRPWPCKWRLGSARGAARRSGRAVDHRDRKIHE